MDTRRVVRRVFANDTSSDARTPEVPVVDELAYKGYRIEPGSYFVHTNAWVPRVVIALAVGGGVTQRTPVYSTNSARYVTQEEADRHALALGRQWIDAEVKRH